MRELSEITGLSTAAVSYALRGERVSAQTAARVRREADRIGFEQAEAFEPAAYAPNLFRGSAVRILRRAFPSATLWLPVGSGCRVRRPGTRPCES